MDELNQIQNPNISAPMMPNPNMPPVSHPATKKAGKWLWIVLAVAFAVSGSAWWYINNMVPETVVQDVEIDQDVRDVTLLNREVEETDLGDIDGEFESIDKDINSL